jgi:queuine/archaeosine tRNA-ribosyltransferase
VLRLCRIHNLTYVLGLMADTRAAIATGTLAALVAATRETWDR